MIVDEAVRGHVPPLWFWALPGIDRIRAFEQSQLPSPPIARLLGIRAGHVGPGSGTWVMPATGWSSIATGELELSMFAETAATGVAMTTLAPGLDVEPVSLVLNAFRPTRPLAGNLLARARVVNASRLYVFVEIEVEDPQGRKVAHGTSQCEVLQVEPPPPPPPPELRRVDEAAYSTPDPFLRAVRSKLAEVDTAGDGFFVRFDSPARALACARAAREAVKRLGIDIRAGIHTGECELQGRALTGMAVHVAARIQGLGGPGDILVSSTVKDIVVGSDTRFEDRGQHALKGMSGEWRLFSLAD